MSEADDTTDEIEAGLLGYVHAWRDEFHALDRSIGEARLRRSEFGISMNAIEFEELKRRRTRAAEKRTEAGQTLARFQREVAAARRREQRERHEAVEAAAKAQKAERRAEHQRRLAAAKRNTYSKQARRTVPDWFMICAQEQLDEATFASIKDKAYHRMAEAQERRSEYLQAVGAATEGDV